MNNISHKFGLGLRAKHYSHVLEHNPQVDFFEIISENYMNSRGRPREMLDKIRTNYPIITHGVSLSIGSTDPLNMEYLTRLKNFADEVQPLHISDHLCWTGINHINTHDLLPAPLTEESLEHIVTRIKQVQDFLGRQILIENPSTYLTFRADYIPEYEFMAELAKRADCGILLDVNNVYVSSFNHRLDAKKYIDAMPMDKVQQIHLAGHTNKGTHIVDTHDDHVTNDVWDLYQYALERATHPLNIMVEWDGNIPEFPFLEAELAKARQVTGHRSQVIEIESKTQHPTPNTNHNLLILQTNLQTSIINGETEGAETWIVDKPNFPPESQLGVYVAAYRLRVRDVLADDYEATRDLLGVEAFTLLVKDYIAEQNSEFYDMSKYSAKFCNWLQATDAPRFVKELADLEMTISQVFDMENTPAATPQDFAGIAEDKFDSLHITPRKAAVFKHYTHDVNEYMSGFVTGEKIIEPKKRDIYMVIYRRNDKAYRLELDKAESEFLQSLSKFKTIGEAINNSKSISEETLQNWFSKWISNQLISLN